MAPMSIAAVRHAANIGLIARLTTELKKARAAAKVTGVALAKEKASEEKAALAKARTQSKPKVLVPVRKKFSKPVKGGIKSCKPVVAVAQSRGRPSSAPGECNQCRRLREGRKGGHGHAPWCNKKLYVRMEP